MTELDDLLNNAGKFQLVETPTNIVDEAHADYLASLPRKITLYDTTIGQQAILWAKYGNQVIGRED